MDLARLARHLTSSHAALRRFPDAALDRIQQAIASGEQHHSGQVCFAIEGALHFGELWRGVTARRRAHDVFAHLRVWDTEQNSGVLIYVLIADRAIEIVADRGIAARVEPAQWQAVCARMRDAFLRDDYVAGAIAGCDDVAAILAPHFPRIGAAQANELPDRPVRL